MHRRNHQIFTTIRTEGTLLPVDFLQRLAEGGRGIKGLTPEDYHLGKTEKLNEAINRAWTRCEGVWRSFASELEKLPESDQGTTLTRERWLLILFQELGYGRLLTTKAFEIKGKRYPVSHLWNHTPIHLVSFRHDLDRRTPGVAGAATMSPHSMVQEFLNRSDEHLWGVVSNGLKLRLLRDNKSLVRDAYVEFDLEAMMNGEVFSDFALLYILLHQSRVEADKPEKCYLEIWTREAFDQGARALDQLRSGVENAIAALGQGFIEHPANTDLRGKLRSNRLMVGTYYRMLLRLVYRMIFLLVAEERNLLLKRDVPAEARKIYMDHYSFSRVRNIAGSIRGSRHGDIWRGLAVTFRCLAEGSAKLGLNPLGGFLFSEKGIADFEKCELTNMQLLEAVRSLGFIRDNRALRPVDYRNLGTEELGSVYESLLELHPDINIDANLFELVEYAGSERKTTGSYYTPAPLIKCLLDSALEPVIRRALDSTNPESAILNLKVVDPACGSGHFLIAAANRIGKHLAILRTGESEPPPEERRRAMRDVVSHCIYGVDLNPLAVELCKVALWIETIDPGKPLGFLDHRIKHGNSLIGATPELLDQGIPDAAFKPVEGDDKKIATEIRKRNKKERTGYSDMFSPVEKRADLTDAAEFLKNLEQLPEDAISQVREKVEQYERLIEDEGYRHQKQVADLWTASFFWPLNKNTQNAVPTEDVFRRFREKTSKLNSVMMEQLETLAERHRYFHWHLEFPEVFAEKVENGFDCVLGNPPWEKLQTEELQFFSIKDPKIASLKGAQRKKAIKKLKESNPQLALDWGNQRRFDAEQINFIRISGSYFLTGVGKFNSFALFAELNYRLLGAKGYAGCIVPTGIATDDNTKLFFKEIVKNNRLVSLFDFQNNKPLFPSVHRQYKFCLLTLCGELIKTKDAFYFMFFGFDVDDLKNSDKIFQLSRKDIISMNPNTFNCPIFRYKRDAEISKKIYEYIPVFNNLSKGQKNYYTPEVWRLFNTTDDSSDFIVPNDEEDLIGLVPIVEAKMIHQFDHRFASYNPFNDSIDDVRELNITEKDDPEKEVFSRYYVPEPVFKSKIRKGFDEKKWFITARNITNATNERTVIASIVPRIASCEVTPYIFVGDDTKKANILVGALNSFVLDYIARQKIGGLHLSYFILYQLPIIPPEFIDEANRKIIHDSVLELSYSSYALKDYASGCGHEGPPFYWNQERRFQIRCELDALFFHLYRINRSDVDYIMDSFPILKRRDQSKHGEYRTKRVILEIYDEMAQVMRTEIRYQSRLAPPPGPPRDEKGNFIPMEQWDPDNWPSNIHRPEDLENKAVFVEVRYELPQDETPEVFPWEGREKFVWSLIPHLIEQTPGLPFETYRTAAVLAASPEKLRDILPEDKAAEMDALSAKTLDACTFPDVQRFRPKQIRKSLVERKKWVRIDPDSRAATILDNVKLPKIGPDIKAIIPFVLLGVHVLEKMKTNSNQEEKAAFEKFKSIESAYAA